jgi:hypothetical protein
MSWKPVAQGIRRAVAGSRSSMDGVVHSSARRSYDGNVRMPVLEDEHVVVIQFQVLSVNSARYGPSQFACRSQHRVAKGADQV